MAQLNAANSSYPASLDTASTLTDGVGGDEIVAQHQNGPASAIIALETELGTDPAGSATDVKARLAVALNDAGAVTLGTAASTVGLLAFNRGGLGQTVASTTLTADGYLVGFANGQLQPLTLTSANGIGVVSTSGTWTIGLLSTAKLSGDTVQVVRAASTTATSGATAIPSDNTPILSTEGNQFLAIEHKPSAVGNGLVIDINIMGAHSTNGAWAFGLFSPASTSAVTAGQCAGSANVMGTARLVYTTTTNNVASNTWTVRAGGAAGATFTLNGQGGAALYAEKPRSDIVIWEIQN